MPWLYAESKSAVIIPGWYGGYPRSSSYCERIAFRSNPSRTVSRIKCAVCPGGTKSCTEAGNSHTSSTSHGRKTLLMLSSGSNSQRSVHCVFCHYPDRLLGGLDEFERDVIRA